jgi:hypothetical protein
MAAREHEPEPLVGDRGDRVVLVLRLGRDGGERVEVGGALAAAGLAAQAVDRAVARADRDPRRRVVRDAGRRPALERDEERVLDRLLGAVEVAERARQRGDRLPRLAPEQAVGDDRGVSGAGPRQACVPSLCVCSSS